MYNRGTRGNESLEQKLVEAPNEKQIIDGGKSEREINRTYKFN